MTDPVTPYVGLTKPTVGADSNAWGAILNGDIDLLDTFLRALVPAGTIFEFAGAASPAGFLFCNGQAVSRTTYADLFAALGTTWGVGDGSTTFNVPDKRDRVGVGAGSAYTLGATGGAASFTPTISLSIATHALTVPELPSHNHTATDSGHSHTDAGHVHAMDANFTGLSITDGGHAHVVPGNVDNNGPFTTGHAYTASPANTLQIVDAPTTSVTANIGLSDPTHSHSMHAGFAVILNGTANITVGSTGSGTAHGHTGSTATSNAVSTLQPYVAVNFIIKT